MGFETFLWSSVTTAMTSFFGSQLIGGALTTLIALALGAFGLQVVKDAFGK